MRVSPALLDTVSRRAGQRLQLRLLAGSKKTDWRLVLCCEDFIVTRALHIADLTVDGTCCGNVGS